MSVVITSGFKNFHLSAAAAEANKRGILEAWYCGFYPKRAVRYLLDFLGLSKVSKLKKLIARRVFIDERFVRNAMLSELLGDIAIFSGRVPLAKHYTGELACFSMRMFAYRVSKALISRSANFEIFHYRSGFGSSSLVQAKRKGALLLCDHSIAHPLVLDGLIRNQGRILEISSCGRLRPHEALIQHDIDCADHVLVNSEFVRDTFAHIGFDTSKISVIYQGLDDVFYQRICNQVRRDKIGEVRFLFAGHFGDRKGARVLLDAVRLLPKAGWSLAIAGTIAPEFSVELKRMQTELPIICLGSLDRFALADVMCESDVLVFPTFAEGSARVVFEAMASGCYIITTRNAGSIVQNHVHGLIVQPGNSRELGDAMRAAIYSDNLIARTGAANAKLIANSFRQKHYGAELASLYERLADNVAKQIVGGRSSYICAEQDR